VYYDLTACNAKITNKQKRELSLESQYFFVEHAEIIADTLHSRDTCRK